MQTASRTWITLSCVFALSAIAPRVEGQTAPAPSVESKPAKAAKPADPALPPAAPAQPAATPSVAPEVPSAAAPAPAAPPSVEAPPPAPSPAEGGAPPCEVEPCPAPLPDSTAVPTTAPAPVQTSYPPTPYYPQPATSEPSDVPVALPEYGPGPVLSGRPARLNSPGAREHDGFFLRLTIGAGAGFSRYRESVDGRRVEDVKTGGVAGQLELAIGGRVVGNLIVHGNVLVGGVGDANKTVSGVKDASNDISSSVSVLGGGVTYYFMPYNAYISGMIGAAGMNETRDEQLSVETGTGVGGALMLGKEWWVGHRAEWGMGAALRGAVLSAPVSIAGIESRMLSSQVTIAVSVTFN